MNDNDIKETLASIFESVLADNNASYTEVQENALKQIENSKLELSKPEYFNLFISSKIEDIIEGITSKLHKEPLESIVNKHKPDFVYANYNFLNRHIRNLCVKRQGISSSEDKSRWIISKYFEYSLTGEFPIINEEEDHYWIPKFGSAQDWIDFCDGLYSLFYGNPEKYLTTYSKLLQYELRTYKHILHLWYIEFKDGEVFRFDNSWDDNLKNPLEDEAFDKGDFYIMNARRLKHRNYEIYVDDLEDNHELFAGFYCKVPKEDIVKVYKVSEERML